MRTDEILKELNDLAKNSWNLPLTGGRGFVNVNHIVDLLREFQQVLPNELDQAKAIIADRSKIISDAKLEADGIVAVAQEKARLMVEKNEIVRQAQEKADALLMEAKVQTREIKKATTEYIDDIMKKTDEALMNSVADLRKTRQSLKNKI